MLPDMQDFSRSCTVDTTFLIAEDFLTYRRVLNVNLKLANLSTELS